MLITIIILCFYQLICPISDTGSSETDGRGRPLIAAHAYEWRRRVTYGSSVAVRRIEVASVGGDAALPRRFGWRWPCCVAVDANRRCCDDLPMRALDGGPDDAHQSPPQTRLQCEREQFGIRWINYRASVASADYRLLTASDCRPKRRQHVVKLLMHHMRFMSSNERNTGHWPPSRTHADLFINLGRSAEPRWWRGSSNGRRAVDLQSNRSRIEIESSL